MDQVDLVVLSRDLRPLSPEVMHGLNVQAGVFIRLHRIQGTSLPTDTCRWETIARARNHGAQQGCFPWLMFLDDDVVLAPNCVRAMLDELQQQPSRAAVAADYLGEANGTAAPRHVGMGATLFRRDALQRIRFRFESAKCECQCCCDDLRASGLTITYSQVARAFHLSNSSSGYHHSNTKAVSKAVESGRVLAAFDRNHFEKFRDQFLASLRSSGNDEWVTVVGYGLYPSQLKALERMHHVEVYACPPGRNVGPPHRRLKDFQTVVAQLNEMTPVAYWDVGDVVFQGSLKPLWEEASAYPDKLLVAREPISHPENAVVERWTQSIDDPHQRRIAFELLSKSPVLNSGFAAGTAKAMLHYLDTAYRLRLSVAMRGSTDWGDQTAMNLYCYNDLGGWRETQDGWNYCLFGRKQVWVNDEGFVVNGQGTPIHAIHGNGGVLNGLLGIQRLLQRVRSYSSSTAMLSH